MTIDLEASSENGTPVQPHPYAYDLQLTFEAAWTCLSRGVNDRRSPFHTPSIATIGLDGRPRVRTVVLRGADPVQKLLRFHTDLRGGKVAEIERDPRIALHAYDPREKFQVRVEGTAAVHAQGKIADEAWAASKSMSRACYAVQVEPGRMLEGEDEIARARELSDVGLARANFSVVVVQVERIETLYLAHAGHRRAVFELGEAVTSNWLAP
jgi:pyridoxamine 5'-phosphate oxidase